MTDCLQPLGTRRGRLLLPLLLLLATAQPAYAEKFAALPLVTVKSVTVEDDSVKVLIDPASAYAAADYRIMDYRIMDVSNPSTVKYFGLRHLTAGWAGNALSFAQNFKGNVTHPLKTIPGTPGQTQGQSITVPAWEVQWNGLTPGQPVTLVVQAVNAVGPFPPGNLYDTATDQPLETCMNGMCMLGGNHGITLDGLESINGQGPSTNIPVVIAQSAPFTVTPNASTVPIPSGTDATSSLMERFPGATFTAVPTLVPGMDEASWLTTTGTTSSNAGRAWDVEAHSVDTNLTQPFVADSHYMDILSDGGTVGKSSNPPHVAHASISPQQTVSFANGRILHVTGEWDSHQNTRRWTGIGVFPADDRAVSQDPRDYAINVSDMAFIVEMLQSTINFEDCIGPQTASDPSSVPTIDFSSAYRPYLYGPKLKPTAWSSKVGPVPVPNAAAAYAQIASGFDDRRRCDLFLSQTHAAFYEDGVLVTSLVLPQPLGFTTAKVYYTHYAYHLALDHVELGLYEPWETFWLNTVPYSDERHWDDCGFEVLPATTDWHTLKLRRDPIAPVAPTPAP